MGAMWVPNSPASAEEKGNEPDKSRTTSWWYMYPQSITFATLFELSYTCFSKFWIIHIFVISFFLANCRDFFLWECIDIPMFMFSLYASTIFSKAPNITLNTKRSSIFNIYIWTMILAVRILPNACTKELDEEQNCSLSSVEVEKCQNAGKLKRQLHACSHR